MIVISEQLTIVTLDVVKISAIVNRGRGNMVISAPSIRSYDLCESYIRLLGKSCMLPGVSTVVGACIILVPANNLV